MKKLLSLFLLSWAATALGQYYVPPYAPWRQTILTNLTVAGVRSDLGIINATNVVVNDTQLDTTGDVLSIKDGVVVTNLLIRGATSTNSVGTNAFTGLSIYSKLVPLEFWPATAAGTYIDFHRADKTVPQYFRWYDEDSTELSYIDGLKPWFGFGPDIVSPANSYFCFYDSCAGVDVFNMGSMLSNRCHVAINTVPSKTRTFVVQDLLTDTNVWSVNNEYTMEIISRTNVSGGLLLDSYSVKYNGIHLYRGVGAANWILFDQGASTYDWRLGGVGNNLVFYSGGAAASTAYAPGTAVVTLTAGTTNGLSAESITGGTNSAFYVSNAGNVTATSYAVGATAGITTNLLVVLADTGITNQLQFTKGILTAVVPQ